MRISTLTPFDAPVALPMHLLDTTSIEHQLADLAAANPSRARLVDIGDSARKVRGEGDGRDVLALVVGEHAEDPSVPRILLTAGVHGDESSNPEVLLAWARRTIEGAAAGDALRSAMLRERTVVVVPVVNPDGRDAVVEGLVSGDPVRSGQRGNDGATGHVDLNRNFDNRWGAGSPDPTSRNYRGPRAASEPEVRAIQELGARMRPAAVYDVHSSGEVVLFPRGAPDSRAAAELVARVTGYETSTSEERWPVPVGGGTVKDWAHDQLGAVSLTIETGAKGASHLQDDVVHADTLARVLPALDALVATVDGTRALSTQPPRAGWSRVGGEVHA